MNSKILFCGAVALVGVACVDAFAEPAQFVDYEITRLPDPLVMKPPTGAKARFRAGVAAKEDKFLSVPFEYRRTAILRNDIVLGLMDKSIFALAGSGIVLKAGAKGYWAGRFRSQLTTTYGYGQRSEGSAKEVEIWCFFGVNNSGADAHACVTYSAEETKLIRTSLPPYLAVSFSTSDNPPSIPNFAFDEQSVTMGENLSFDYSFGCIRTQFVCLDISVNGQNVGSNRIIINSSGDGRINSPIGELRIKANNALQIVEIVAPIQRSANAQFATPAITDETSTRVSLRLAEYMEQLANEEDEKPLELVKFIDVPQAYSEPRRLARFSEIARQKYIPARVFTQRSSPQNRPNRFGPAGAVLYEVHIGVVSKPVGGLQTQLDPTRKLRIAYKSVMCWQDWAGLTTYIANPTFFGYPKSSCLEDTDNDGKYDKLYRDVAMVEGSIYKIASISGETNLADAPVEITPSDNANLPPEEIRLFYMGTRDERVEASGKISPTSVKLEWRYNTLPRTNSVLGAVARSFLLEIGEDGRAVYKDDDGQPAIIISNFQPDGSADIMFTEFYQAGIVPLDDFKDRALALRNAAKSIRD